MSNLEFPNPLPARSESPTPKDKAPKETKPSGRASPLENRLHEAISGVGLMVAMMNEVDGLAILNGAERLSSSLDKAAKQSPAVRRALEAALTGGVWAEVVFASSAIVVPIALNHGLAPAVLSGFVKMPIPAGNNGDSSS